ncbi:MAG: hypothetical protein K0S53_676 [Bacteroidetes bacterium]|jgi:hypothetical protein|nr:hypothetical protein [Bacteroidota bacterium]
MGSVILSDSEVELYQSDIDDDSLRKYILVAAMVGCFSEAPKIQAATYSANQIELKLQEINGSFDIEKYIDISKAFKIQNDSEQSVEFKNMSIISPKIDKEFEKYSNYIEKDISSAKAEATGVAKVIAQIKFDKISVELTPSNTIKFTLTFDKEKMLMVTYPFDTIEGVNKGDVVFSVFVNRKHIASDSMNLTDLVAGFNNFLSV